MKDKNETYSYLGGLMHGIGSLLTGMKTTMTVFCRRKVTEQYPENRATLEMFDRFRGTLTMPHNERNEHHCIACGQAVTQSWQNMHEPRSYSYFANIFFILPYSDSIISLITLILSLGNAL